MPPPRFPVPTRWFLGLTGLLFVFVVAAIHRPALYQLYRLPLCGDVFPYFADAGGMLAGADALRENGGRFSWDYLTATGNPYNYPRVWSYAGWFGLGQAQRLEVGVTFAALLLGSQFWLLRPRDGWTFAVAMLVLFSPACLLLLERGNNDAPVFALVVAGTGLLAGTGRERWGASGGLLLAAACLKLYPIFAVAAVPPRRGRWGAPAGVAALLGLFILYAVAMREDFGHIAGKTPRAYHGAYGALTLTSFVRESLELRGVLAKMGVDLSAPEFRAQVEGVMRISSLAVLLGLGAGALGVGLRSTWGREPVASFTERDGVRFRAGAAIYGGTFLLGNNWDYRLVFLSLTVPLLCGWLRGEDLPRRRWAAGVLVLIVVSLWAYAAPRTAWTFGLVQVSNWALLAALVFLFGRTLPPEFREPLQRALGGPAGGDGMTVR